MVFSCMIFIGESFVRLFFGKVDLVLLGRIWERSRTKKTLRYLPRQRRGFGAAGPVGIGLLLEPSFNDANRQDADDAMMTKITTP